MSVLILLTPASFFPGACLGWRWMVVLHCDTAKLGRYLAEKVTAGMAGAVAHPITAGSPGSARPSRA